MKKLMCAIAAVSAGICLADVSSANVVGYQNKKITTGEMNCLAATFLPVGKDGKDMKLGDVKAGNGFMFASDSIMFLTSDGATKATYTYVGPEEAAEYKTTPGWYDFDYVIGIEWDWASQIPEQYQGNGIALPYGTMIIVQSGMEGATLDSAGEVLNVDKDFELVAGEFNMLGNATPVDRILGDISTGNGFMFASDSLMFLTADGATKATYTYVGPEEAAEYKTTPGWYDFDYVIGVEWNWASQIPEQYQGNAVGLSAGAGFIVQTGSDGATLTIPKAY